ncbi:alpha/beta fold hydrolase [Fibrisoma montanum]|uniref:Alpha/beta fold hydrolase n=1 Tax=Fibrisoma montanum TaxID=2305895 RepID=A0A418M6Q8_9BACT|nr:alpha/beta fold hydrolase [Fibrisoma montanum]RIV21521.1 alpha/beta fold hydrolase [Fibrisoma montanum]
MKVQFTIPTRDRYSLTAHLFQPVNPKAVLLISGACAVGQYFYFNLAAFLEEQGFAVLTYDYRGIGQSAPERLTRRFEAGISVMASDFDDVVGWIEGAFPTKPIGLLGHSLGGICAVLSQKNNRFYTMFTVGTQMAYYKDWGPDWWTRTQTFLNWHVIMPTVTKLVGYMPGRQWHLGMENLPATLVRDIHNRRKYTDIYTYLKTLGLQPTPERIRCPVMAMTTYDDPICTTQALDRFFGELSNARIVRRRLEPAATQHEPVGHLNFFRKRFASFLWDMVSDWFDTYLPTPVPPQPTSRSASPHFAFYAYQPINQQ